MEKLLFFETKKVPKHLIFSGFTRFASIVSWQDGWASWIRTRKQYIFAGFGASVNAQYSYVLAVSITRKSMRIIPQPQKKCGQKCGQNTGGTPPGDARFRGGLGDRWEALGKTDRPRVTPLPKMEKSTGRNGEKGAGTPVII